MRQIIPVFFLSLAVASAQAAPINFDAKIQKIFSDHFLKFQKDEYYSGAALSVYLPKEEIKNYYLGSISHDTNSEKISANTLFHIGSITKSFTAVLALQAEKAKKLTLNDSINQWLPQYNKWGTLAIKNLLNMSSGLPNYSDTPLWNTEEYHHPDHAWTNEQLIDYVYPPKFSPPLKSGYFYSNTGYLLINLMVEKATQTSFSSAMDQLIQSADLQNTFYPVPNMTSAIQTRLSEGYNYNQYDNPALVGKSLRNNNLTWAGAAGAIVGNSEDIIKWVRALFVENKILTPEQKTKLMQLVSMKTGKPIKNLTKEDSHGFGLGVAEAFEADSDLGHFWLYEGSTPGFRALYMYVPCNGIIVSTIFNSATNSENDHIHDLLKKVYLEILAQNPKLKCAKK